MGRRAKLRFEFETIAIDPTSDPRHVAKNVDGRISVLPSIGTAIEVRVEQFYHAIYEFSAVIVQF